MYFLLKKGDMPASYVSLPEGTWFSWIANYIVRHTWELRYHLQDASDHQNYSIFRIGVSENCHCYWEGATPKISPILALFSWWFSFSPGEKCDGSLDGIHFYWSSPCIKRSLSQVRGRSTARGTLKKESVIKTVTQAEQCQKTTLPEMNSSQVPGCTIPKGSRIVWKNHPFSGVNSLLVSGRV